jgi:hypothetical protein
MTAVVLRVVREVRALGGRRTVAARRQIPALRGDPITVSYDGSVEIEQLLHAAGFVRRTTSTGVLLEDEDRHLVAVPSPVGVFLGWADVRWDGPHAPRLWLRDVEHVVDSRALGAALPRVEAARDRHLVRCRFCGDALAPGHADAGGACHGCASAHRGTVY